MMKSTLKSLLTVGGFSVIAAAAAWFVQPDETAADAAASLRHQHLLDEIAALESTALLPPLYQNWRDVSRYVSLYDHASLVLLDAPAESAAMPFKTASKRALLSGSPSQVFAVARRVQRLAPVFFERFSLEVQQQQDLAKLVMYVLGQQAYTE